MPGDQARHEANLVLHSIPQKLRSAPERSEPAAWMADPLRWRRLCDVTGRTLLAAPAATPSRRLLNDQTAKALTGIADALNGLALLTDGAVRPDHRHRGLRFQVADWLPPLVNGARAFIVIGAASLFWIATAWPQGASAAAFAAIVVILFSPYADQASAASVGFMTGTVLAAVLVAIIKFAVLPGIDTFEALSIELGLYLIPIGALMMHGWQPTIFTGMIIAFVPLLAPANQMTYSTVDYYNAALAIITGGGAAALSFRLIPALSPAFRARRLLTLHLRDLRRLAAGDAARTVDDWEACAYGRLSALPDQATPLQRSQFVAALAVGAEIIRLRSMVSELDLGADADVAFAALAQGQSPAARAQLEKIDRDLSLIPGSDSQSPLALQARAAILMISEALAQHASYFDAGERT
jgi:uncharacterized membrane protein YccC